MLPSFPWALNSFLLACQASFRIQAMSIAPGPSDMQASLPPASAHIPGWIVALLCLSAISLLILWVASFMQSRRLNLIRTWRWGDSPGTGFAGNAVTWSDINEADDRSFVSERTDDPSRSDEKL
jgi:hypothetical protein